MTFRLILAAVLASVAVPVWAQGDVLPASPTTEVASASSPDGSIRVSLTLNGQSRVGYAVRRAGKPLIDESHLGFLFTDAPQMMNNFAFLGQTTREVDETWAQPWGEWRTIRNHYREIAATFEEKTPLKRRMEVQFRVYDTGVGFRIVLPAQPNLKTARIAEELTRFSLHSDGEAWWDPAFEANREEYLFTRTPISAVATAQTPITFKLADGTHLSFHEAALVDYSAMNLARVEGTMLKAVLTLGSGGPKVVRDTPFSTPWRTIAITSDAPSLYGAANQLILNLNEPNKLGDVSWVKPRKYVGIWWGMHLDTQSWNTGPKHGATTANAIALIDFAAKYKIPGLLIEGWNKGWDGDWFANGEDFSFTEPTADFDLARVAAYAKAKGVHLIGHHETSANAAHYESQMGAGFDLYRKLGIDTVKTGYVSEAGAKVLGADGKIQFAWHEGQAMVNHHLLVVTEAAKRHIAIDAHEPVKDTGLRRTYPNWISREGQRGMEYNAWGTPKNPPEHEANLFFTRMTTGPMDFTPGIVSLKGRGNSDILSTLAKQLALYLVLYSPVQMMPDLPENYLASPVAFKFIREVPVDWDDTRVLGGEVGDFVVVARKERGGKGDWYVGAVSDEQARDVSAKLDFLTPGRTYTATIYRDGPTASFGAKGKDMVVETRKVTSRDTLALHLAPGGGAAVRIALGR